MQSVRHLTATMSVACALVALTTGQTLAAFINLTPLAGASNSVDSVLLSDLVEQEVDGLIVGDKIFTGFSYSATGDMPASTAVNVLGFRDNDGNWGITLQGAFADIPGGGASDAGIRFMVEVDPAFAAQGWRISDAHLFLSGPGVLGEGSFFSVDESFLGINEAMNVFTSTINGGTQVLSDWVYFTPLQTKLTVTKDIFAFANPNGTAPSRATLIDQSFSQTLVPEPSTIALMGLALTFFGCYGYRRRTAT